MAKTLTEEDYARIREEARRVRDRALGLVEERPENSFESVPKPGASRKGMKMTGTPRYSRERVRQMHVTGKKAPEIAKALGCSKTTIYRILSELGYSPKHGRSGPEPKTHCKRDHDLAVHGKPHPNGGRECQECKRERAREWWRKNRGAKT